MNGSLLVILANLLADQLDTGWLKERRHVEDDALTLPPDRSTEQDAISTLDHTSQKLDNEPLANVHLMLFKTRMNSISTI